MSSTLIIKNMVCRRCLLAAEDILRSEAIPFQQVVFGEIRFREEISADQKQRLSARLTTIGFEIIEHTTGELIEKIRQLVRKRARNEADEQEDKRKLSQHISASVHHEYTYLSSLFSATEGRTIENYFIEQRIEKVKELLADAELSLSQIAFDLAFSSVAHLSTQFKQITGLTPTQFKNNGGKERKSIDEV